MGVLIDAMEFFCCCCQGALLFLRERGEATASISPLLSAFAAFFTTPAEKKTLFIPLLPRRTLCVRLFL